MSRGSRIIAVCAQLLALLAASSPSSAATLRAFELQVVDRDGRPVPGARVELLGFRSVWRLSCLADWPDHWSCPPEPVASPPAQATDEEGLVRWEPLGGLTGRRATASVSLRRRFTVRQECPKPPNATERSSRSVDWVDLPEIGDSCYREWRGRSAIRHFDGSRVICRIGVEAAEALRRKDELRRQVLEAGCRILEEE